MAVTIADCRNIVGKFYRIPRETMLGQTHKRKVARPRQMAMVLAREFAVIDGKPASYPRIGQQFGGRDHTTVMHAMKVLRTKEKNLPELRHVMGQFRIALAHRAILEVPYAHPECPTCRCPEEPMSLSHRCRPGTHDLRFPDSGRDELVRSAFVDGVFQDRPAQGTG